MAALFLSVCRPNGPRTIFVKTAPKFLQSPRTAFLMDRKESSKNPPSVECGTDDRMDVLEITNYHGWPQIVVPLVSRDERCKFILKPISDTVGDFKKMISKEDKGVKEVLMLTMKGVLINADTPIQHLLDEDFKLKINNKEFMVLTNKESNLHRAEDLQQYRNDTAIINKLYKCLNERDFLYQREQELKKQREELIVQLLPFEQSKAKHDKQADKQVNRICWLAMGYMAFQTGVFARLTWYDFSWDIIEPCTYFVGYFTIILSYAYFVITRDKYHVNLVRDRYFLKYFYKYAKKNNFDVKTYNSLREQLSIVDSNLERLLNNRSVIVNSSDKT